MKLLQKSTKADAIHNKNRKEITVVNGNNWKPLKNRSN
jgi:hypothetical protein